MSWQNAKKVADDWCAKHLAEVDLKGKLVQLVAFNDDETCRWFYPDRDLGFHKMITTAIAREARKRGAKTIYVPVTKTDYLFGREDLPGKCPPGLSGQKERSEFIEKCHRVLG